MDYKLSDLSLGVIDFFAILLPGSVLSGFLWLAWRLLEHPPLPPFEVAGAPGWVGFIVVSYILGHLAFLVGSPLDGLYDAYRRWRHPVASDRAYLHATEIKERMLGPLHADVINTFRWSKENLQIREPAAASEVHRLEADSKFFRTLIVVFVLVAAYLLHAGFWWHAVAATVIILGSFHRYADQRWKSTQLAYEYLIVLDRLGNKPVNET
jgi:hypothetical protein